MKTFTYTEARNSLKTVLDTVVDDCDQALIHRRDGDNVVIMSESEFNSRQETMHLLSSPANAVHLQRSIDQLCAGQIHERDLLGDEDRTGNN
ncbi:type II toxin-antitoxin system Phd/YefM family antitoxin [Photobacterium sp. SDRW27]|uniref:type II toxin-antitoxin system Phd/YefM family antitoxin n=1 Tax=Photobacterium obscurum TaxID=2829490 RepID=UPI002244C6B0|nr:type II toxin-antitoxin system Phd/YefM family antitoxin [Photobacterium obscurum]MCW8332092.1 type II toxin-antitoxin system Phd/YefM family antitoxin [Photobacterium obscurum]